MSTFRVATVEVRCKRCKKPFLARLADRARGWGKFCSKSCKAIKQEARTGQFGNYIRGQNSTERSNRWTDGDGNRCTRVRDASGRSLISTVDSMTGEVSREEFDRNGISNGFQMSQSQLSGGGYGDSGPHEEFGGGKF
jgi:hypothetical protein